MTENSVTVTNCQSGYVFVEDPEKAKTRTLLMAFRQAIIIVLGALEDYLNIERSIIPKHKR